MHKQTSRIFLMLLMLGSQISLCIDTPTTTVEPQKSYANFNRVLFIFLDDSEYQSSKIGAATLDFLNAFLTQAGPIIVSASILENIKNWQQPDEHDPQILYERLQEDDNIILSTVFSSSPMHEQLTYWIIKKINTSLYLLIPKNYLRSINIDENNVQLVVTENTITATEQKLGLKVNHMHTISSIHEITVKPLRRKPFLFALDDIINQETADDYFTHAIWNTDKKTSAVFVTRTDYYQAKNKNLPLWSIQLTGHGGMYSVVTGLSWSKFKEFLAFLETKINTRLFYYITCYGAGTNDNLIYKDAESIIEKTYSYVIITQALVESPVSAVNRINFEIKNKKLIFTTNQSHKVFVQETKKDSPSYRNLIDYETRIQTAQQSITLATPQIKYPGLPWFSIIDSDPIVSIGSILAKNRKIPLDIATFFPKKLSTIKDSSGKTQHIQQNREIFGILLYAQEIPFDIIINTKNNTGTPPEIISMIPGNITHHLKRISSALYTLPALLDSFIKVNVGIQKTFIIDQIDGIDGTITNIAIRLKPKKNTVTYWTDQNSRIFKKTSYFDLKLDRTAHSENLTTYASFADGEIYSTLLQLVKPVDNYQLFRTTLFQTPISLVQKVGALLHEMQRFATIVYRRSIAPTTRKIATWFKFKKASQNQPAAPK